MKARLQPSGSQLDLGAVYGSTEVHEWESYTIRAFSSLSLSLQAYPEGVQDWCKECPAPRGEELVEGNGKINLEQKEREILLQWQGDGWRQSQIEAERKVKMSEEKENMNRK